MLLKMDACTRIRVKYFAIEVHYFDEDGIVKI